MISDRFGWFEETSPGASGSANSSGVGARQVNGKPEDCPSKIVARRIDAQLDEDHIGFNFASARCAPGLL